MIISDIVARIIIKPLELPIGVVTAVIGAIVLIYIMKKGRQRLWPKRLIKKTITISSLR